MNKELQNWAEKVIVDCSPILQKYKLDFYPFQSKLNESLDILIIGLNPGSNSYDGTDKLNDSTDNLSLTIEQIFDGNSEYNSNKESWKIYQNLMKIDFVKDLSSQFNYMNYVYFPTPRFNDIKKIIDFEVINICKSLTLDFIKIINPKIIIVLGTSTGIDIIAKNTKTILNGYKKRLLVQGEIEGLTAYGIPHPSYNNFQEENEEISKVLQALINGDKVVPYSLSKAENIVDTNKTKRKFDIQKINNELKNLISFEEFQNKNYLFKAEFKSNNDNLDFRIDIKDGYFAFRALEKINNSFYELNGKEIYKNLFSENSEIEALSGLVYKTFQKYDSHQSIEDQIVNDLKKLLSNIQ